MYQNQISKPRQNQTEKSQIISLGKKIIEYIFSHRSAMKIGSFLMIFFVGNYILGGSVFADDTLRNSIQESILLYNTILHTIYLFTWPALALGAMGLDNGLVYGTFLGLDQPLWIIRNIVKNLANFALAFMVLFAILTNFFQTGEQGKKAFDIIKKALIAGILIQSSWFVMAALIDLSTITTYAIGNIPLSLSQGRNQSNSCPDVGNTKILPVGTKIDFTVRSEDDPLKSNFINYYYVNINDGKKYYANCVIHGNKRVVGQEYRGEVAGMDFEKGYCILPGNRFAYFGPNDQQIATAGFLNIEGETLPAPNNFAGYQSNLHKLQNTPNQGLSNPSFIENHPTLIFDMNIPSQTNGEAGIYNLNSQSDNGIIILNPFATAPTISSLIENTESFSGPFIALYKSIMDFASFNTSARHTDTFIMFLEVLMKTVIAGVIFVPLIITAVALLIRVAYVWMFIALSPLIALKIAFTEGVIKDLLSKIPIIGEGWESVLRIIFAPALITFAVSFALIIMTSIISSLHIADAEGVCAVSSEKLYSELGVIKSLDAYGEKTIELNSNLVEIRQNAFNSDVFGPAKDIFGRIIMVMFGAAMVWLVLLVVIEAVFKGTPIEKMQLSKIATNSLGSLPIIPVPTASGISMIGAGTLGEVGQQYTAIQANKFTPSVRAQEIIGRSAKPKPEAAAEAPAPEQAEE